MNKVYQYSHRRVLFGIYVPTSLSALTVIYLTFERLLGNATALTIPLALLAGIIFLDHFGALSHPERVETQEKSIEFICFGRRHRYTFDQIVRINIRKTAFSKNIYVRINDAGLIKGRYWLQIEQLNEGQELLKFLEGLVELKHPMMKNFVTRSFVKTK